MDKYRVPGGDNDLGETKSLDPHERLTVYAKSTRKLRDAYQRHREALAVGNLEREQPFSWQYCLISLVSYALVLSDVFRTGLAIKTLEYRTLEPDSYVFFGPLAYVMQHLTLANATATDTTNFWAYKYDTTSITMRAVAQLLELKAWPPCVLYKQRCDESRGLPLASVFGMVDSLVGGVAAHTGLHAGRRAANASSFSGLMTLRSESEYKDRVHHYAMPWFFEDSVKRTSQAVHYTHPTTGDPAKTLLSICAERDSVKRPYACDQSWTNARRLNCATTITDAACQSDTPRIWDAIPLRQAELARAYPNHTLDFVLLGGMEDYPRSSLTFQGRKYFEVVVFTRIRKCETVGHTAQVDCTAVAVDDYRYEAASFIMNAPDWYYCVGILRAAGQAYAWLRVTSLVAGCCIARLREKRFREATLTAKVAVTLRTVFLIPSQVVIYGSTFPVTCYVVAHLIDCPAAYAIVEAYFNSWLGQVQWKLSDFIQHCAVSMRTVWVIGFACHRLVAITTNSNWSPVHGVPGTAEFSITFIASLTIFAQFRAVAFRRAAVHRVYEVVPSAHRAKRLADGLDSSRSFINKLISGSPVDVKCLLCGFLGLWSVTAIVWVLRHAFPKLLPLRLTLTSSTIAPYSAGQLWPRSRLVVSWYGTVLSFEKSDEKALENRKPRPATAKVATAASASSSSRRQSAYQSLKHAHRIYRELMDLPDKALVMRETTVSKMLQEDMHSVDRRSREIESTVYLVNLAVMTDPFTFLDLRVFDGRLVGLYETKATRRCFLLPFGLMTSVADIPIEWDELELVAVVNTKDLEWPDLLHCG